MAATRHRTLTLRLLAAVVSALVALTLLPSGASAAPADDEATDFALTNASRAAAGVAPLALDPNASNVARAWSQHMASTGVLAHNPYLASQVDQQVTPQWTMLGENVGVGSSVTSLHNAFMNSPAHRANIMNSYNRIGIGAVRDRLGQLWITVVFVKGPAIGQSLPPSAFAPFDGAPPFAGQQYLDFLNRAADPVGQSVWTQMLIAGWTRGVDMIAAFLNSAEFNGNASPVTRLYFAYFLRIPDYTGLQYWINQKKAGVSLASISQNFASSQEFRNRYGSLSNSQFVTQVYLNVLHRTPDGAGLTFWTNQLNSGVSRGLVMTGFSESAEYVRTMKSEVDVSMVYIAMLRRSPDADGFAYWVGAEDRGTPIQSLIGGFLSSTEYANRF